MDGTSRKGILCSEDDETESISWQLGEFDRCYSEFVYVVNRALF